MEEYLSIISDYKKRYHGMLELDLNNMDDAIEKQKEFDDNIEFMETRKTTLSNNHRILLTFSEAFNFKVGEIIKKISIEDVSAIQSIELQMGGTQVDKIYPETFSVLRELHNFENDEIPFHLCKTGIHCTSYHEIRMIIYLNMETEIDVSVDVYTNNKRIMQENNSGLMDGPSIVCQSDMQNPDHSNIIMQHYCLGEMRCVEGENRYPLCFNHLVYYIIIMGPINSTPHLKINGDDSFPLYLHSVSNDGRTQCYTLTEDLSNDSLKKYGINFSRIDCPRLIFDGEEGEIINIYGVNANIFVWKNGMGSLKYY